jgi:hypothetical protein
MSPKSLCRIRIWCWNSRWNSEAVCGRDRNEQAVLGHGRYCYSALTAAKSVTTKTKFVLVDLAGSRWFRKTNAARRQLGGQNNQQVPFCLGTSHTQQPWQIQIQHVPASRY